MGSDVCQHTWLENATLEEIEAGLDPDFVPEGWLDLHTPPKKKLKLSLAKKTECTSELSALKASRFATPVSEKKVNEAAKGVVPTNTKKNNAWAERTVILCPLLLQLAPFLVLVFPKHFSSFLASLAALSTFTSLNLTHFGAFLLLPITVAHCCSWSNTELSQTVLYYAKLCSIMPIFSLIGLVV